MTNGEDVVLAYRRPGCPERRLLHLISQLTADEVEEAVALLSDLIADRGCPALIDHPARPALAAPPHRSLAD